MKSTYRVLAYLVLLLVMVQAADLAFGFFGMGTWVESGHSLTKSTLEDNRSGVPGEAGLALHSIIGQFLIPLTSLALVVVSVFAHIEGGGRWAALILCDVVVQVLLAFVSFGVPVIGVLHGLNAFLLLWLAMTAARAATGSMRREPAAQAASAAV
ncbi:MAG: hypothetical protein L0H96_08830 [Humibacillus sp.]|nr:hypothetical protein [Humibacillus sp.]MDN5777000.1 hypothetical protein [Humibacillus sp.]